MQHVIARFVGKEPFLDTPGARSAYLERLGRALAHHDCTTLAYSLMSTHLHLVLIMALMSLERLFERVHTGFGLWINGRLGRIGPVFAERPKNITIAMDLGGIVIPYAHNNEVRAGVVRSSGQSRWSSHPYYAGLASAPPWLAVEEGLRLCGFDASEEGRGQFCDWVSARSVDPRLPALCGEGDDAAVRALLEQHPRCTGLLAPTATGRDRLEWTPRVSPLAPSRDRWPGRIANALLTASLTSGVSVDVLRSRDRSHGVARTRGALMLAWRDGLGRNPLELRQVLGLSSAAASAACRRAQRDPAQIAKAAEITRLCWAQAASEEGETLSFENTQTVEL